MSDQAAVAEPLRTAGVDRLLPIGLQQVAQRATLAMGVEAVESGVASVLCDPHARPAVTGRMPIMPRADDAVAVAAIIAAQPVIAQCHDVQRP